LVGCNFDAIKTNLNLTGMKLKSILLGGLSLLTFGVFGQSDLIISAVYDGPLSGGTPKGIELYAINNIADLSEYGVGSANNGDGSDGVEFALSGSASEGEYIYIASEMPQFMAFFGFEPNFTDGAMAINGDDAVELFRNGNVVDLFGDINVDGSGQAWEYTDSWARRNDDAAPSTSFNVAEWTFGGVDALDGATDNATAGSPVPVGTFTTSGGVTPPEPGPMSFDNQLGLSLVGTYATGVFDEGAAEIAAHDPATQRVFFVNADSKTVDVLDIANPANPTFLFSIDLTPYGDQANSVAVNDGVVAAAVEDTVKQNPGKVVFFDTDGNYINDVMVGALPDMLTYTPDGMKVLVANEGEPNDDYDVDPEGSISVVDISNGIASATVTTIGFGSLTEADVEGVRIFGPGASIAQDLEPEYITVSDDSQTAYAVCQENNALIIIDLATNGITDVVALGTKDYSLPGNGIDASNDSDGIQIENWPVKSFYMPDAIASYSVGGSTYILTANEGDSRDYDGFSEEDRVKDLTLDSIAFPNYAELQMDENLGRLNITLANGDTDNDGEYEEIFGYGARSFSIWDENGNLVWDSGDDFEQITADYLAPYFNSNNDDNDSFKSRSDDKGPEPEAITVAEINGTPYAFIGLERVGGVMIYDITDPTAPKFENYINNRNFSVDAQDPAAGDLGPEDIKFIEAADSPTGEALVMVANEVSGTISFFSVSTPAYTLQILHASDLEGGVDAIGRAPNFAAIVDALEEEYTNTVRISSGDNYIPGPFFNASSDGSLRPVLQDVNQDLFGEPGLTNLREAGGRADITIANIIGFDASALGNHEFDNGTSIIEEIIGTDIRGPQLSDVRWLGAQFPYLSANLDFSSDDNLSGLYTSDLLLNTAFQSLPSDLTAAGEAPKIAPATLIERDGELIGVVGATTQLLESISTTNGVNVINGGSNDMPALAAILQPVINDLIAEGSNKIILTSHLQQFALEQELATLLSGVDVILAGGSDRILADQTDRLRSGDTAEGDYPFVTENLDGDPTLIVSTDGEYSYVGRLVVGFDENGVILLSSLNEGVNGIYATDDEMIAQIYEDPSMAFAENSKGELVSRLTEAVNDVVIEKDSNILGLTDVYLDGRRERVRTQETNMGNISADANLFVAKEYDAEVLVSIKNGGGIRAAIGEVDEVAPGVFEFLPPQANPISGKMDGEVSQLDVENTLRFNNRLSLLDLSAADLLEVMEHGFSATEEGATPGQFPQIGGMKVSFDPTLEPGDRIQNLVIVDEGGLPLDSVVIDGEVNGDPERMIRVVTLNFLAGGGDGYPFDALGENRVDLDTAGLPEGDFDFAPAGSEQDAFAEYLNTFFSETPYMEAETPVSEDERIQIIGERDDDVFVFCADGFFPAPEQVGVLQNSSADYVVVKWSPVPGSTVCQIRGGLVDGPSQTLLVYADEDGTEPDRRRIPKSQLQLGETYQVEVRCACSEEPLVVSEFSVTEFFIPLGGSAISELNGSGANAAIGSMSMSVYPNPSNVGYINLTLSNAEGMETEGLIEMRDITGRSLTASQVAVGANQTLRLETNDIPAGIYTVSYTSGSERVTQRFIIK
jgi:2',3'-cyclic-nucleotide 2'-phosphodiesterase (5'-nucleotidase family)